MRKLIIAYLVTKISIVSSLVSLIIIGHFIKKEKDEKNNALLQEIEITFLILGYDIQEILFFLFSFKMSTVELMMNQPFSKDQDIVRKLKKIQRYVKYLVIFYVFSTTIDTGLHFHEGVSSVRKKNDTELELSMIHSYFNICVMCPF